MKTKLFTQNSCLVFLMTFVLALSVQGIADALTLTRTSDRVQSNIENSTFEISFSVGLKSDTTAIKNDDGKLITDAATNPPRIDAQGYLVTVIDGRDYRNTTVTDANGSAAQLVPPTPNTPDPPSGLDADNSNTDAYSPYAVYEKVSSSQYEGPYTGAIFANSSKSAFSNRGYPLHYYTAGFMYDGSDANTDEDQTAPAKVSSQIRIRDEQFVTRIAKSNRYHYNDEAIAISVTDGMTVRLKSGSTTYPVNVIDIPTARPDTPANLSITTASLWEGGGIRSLPTSITLICTSPTANIYTVTITDVSPANDFPSNAPETLERAAITFTLYVEDDAAPTGTLDFNEATGSLLRLETAKPIEPIHTHFDLTNTNLANKSIRYKVTTGSGLLYVGTPTREDTTPVSDLTIHKDAMVYLKTNQTDNEVVAAIAGQDLRTHGKTLVFEYTGTDRRTTPVTPTTPTTPTTNPTLPAVTTLTVPSSITGAPGSQRTLSGNAPAGSFLTIGNLNDNFRTAGGTATIAQQIGTQFTSTLTLPSTEGSYTLTVSDGLTSRTVTVTAEAPTPQTGDLILTSDFEGAPNSQSVVTVRATNADQSAASGVSVALSVTNGGGTFSPATVTTGTDGTATSTLTRASTPGTNYFITARASNYDPVQSRISITGTAPAGAGSTPPLTTPPSATGVAASIAAYEGNNQEGSPNIRLLSPLVVEVVDANDNPVPNVRVRFRTTIGSGTFTPRTVRTDAEGFAEVRFTPTSTGRIRVVASVTGVSRNAVFFVQGGELASGLVKVSGDNQNGTPGEALSNPFIVEVQDGEGEPLSDRTVSFHVTAGGGSLSEASVRTGANGRAETLLTLGNQRGVHSVQASVPGVDPVTFTARIEPQILVAAANRPVMYWTDDGMLYRLAEKVEPINLNIENATSWAIGGSKLYWTMTNATNPNRGTLNSANLDGSGATQLNDIYGAPYEIAVDVTKGKLYWTDSLNRIQQSDLSGQNIKNAVRDISGLGTLAVAAGNVYWTEATGRIRSANINGGTPVTPTLASGLGELLSLAVGGNKLYWLERATNGSGKLQRANLDGTGVEVLKSFTRLYDNSLSVDTTRQHLYLAGSGKVSRRNLTGTGYQVVVSGLGNPMSIAIGGAAPTGTATQTPTTTTTSNKYDVNGDGTVDSKDVDAIIVAVAAKITNAKYDVNSDGKVDINDVVAVSANRDAGAASAPALLGTKFNALEVERLQEQIDLLVASGDRSPAALKTLIYLQQLIVMARPEKTQLLANYPNPFNPETWIPYELATDTDVRITIYNAQGVVIRTLLLGQQSAGYYTDRERAAYWDGRNALGEQVASGIYFYQLETDEMSTLRKMVILK